MSSAPTTWSRARLPRDLHPVAWWVWALGLAAGASLTTNPLVLLLLIATACLVVAQRRPDHPWSRSFALYLAMAAAIVVIRVGFRVLFGGGFAGQHVLVPLPSVPLPGWAAGISLLGPVTREALLAGLYDGLRLAAIVVCVGAANALANPKRLLASLPAALHEVGTALVVAVTIVPQLADSLRRVRAAQRLRGGPVGRRGSARIARVRRFLVPILEDALERSLALAAGMDTRGYGRAPDATGAQRRVTGGLLLGGLLGLCVGVYAVLDRTAPRVLATPLLVLGSLGAVGGLWSAGRRVTRSRYRPDPWRWPELVVSASGLVVAGSVWWVGGHDVTLAHPGVVAAPGLSWQLLVALLVGALPGWVAPPPRSYAAPARTPAAPGLEAAA